MPIHVNEKSIEHLVTITGVDAATLKSHIVVDAADAPTETKLPEVIPVGTIVLTPDQKKTFEDNIKSSAAQDIKQQTRATFVKRAIGDGIEVTAAMTDEEVAPKIRDHFFAQFKKETGTDVDKRITELNGTILSLQGTAKTLEQERDTAKAEAVQAREFAGIKAIVSTAIASIPLAAEGAALDGQRTALEELFFANHDIKTIDGKQWVLRKDGSKITNHLHEPVKPADAIKDFAVARGFQIKTVQTGHGGNSSGGQNTGGEIDQQIAAATDIGKFHELLKLKGIEIGTDEGNALFAKWREKHPKEKLV